MTLDYFLLVFIASIGVVQLAAAWSRLNGLLLLGRRLSLVAAPLLVVAAFAWFFLSEPRNIPDTAGGLDGNQQALLFFAAAGAALVSILLVSSLRNWSMAGGEHLEGLEALREATYLRLLLRRGWRLWRGAGRTARRPGNWADPRREKTSYSPPEWDIPGGR